jgi:hypothetical protein
MARRPARPQLTRRWRRADPVADDRFDRAGEGEQFEPCQWVLRGAGGADPSVSEVPEGSERCGWVTGPGGSDGCGCEGKFGRWEVAVPPRSRSALGAQNALFLEVADHPR